MPATKEEIAGKFMELALRHGYRRTSVEDVARALRISKKTVYDHFENKEALLREGILLTAKAQRRRVESGLSADTALGRIEQVVATAFADAAAFYRANPDAGLGDPSGIGADIQDEVFRPLVRDLIADGVAAGEFSVPDIDLAAAFLMAVGMEGVRLLQADPDARVEEAAMDAVRRLLTGGGAR